MLSVFGDVKYDISDNLTINAGARYLYEKQFGRVSATHADFTLAPGGGLDPEQPNLFLFDSLLRYRAPPVGISPTRLGNDVVDAPYGKSWNMWGGKIGLEYKADSGALFYASVTRGQKGGQFTDSPDAVLQGVFFTPVDPETIVSYEAGFKHEWFDRKLQTYLGRLGPFDVQISPSATLTFGSSEGVQEYVDAVGALKDAGVSWTGIAAPNPSRQGYIENVRWFGEEVIARV